jgi:hypothetical protein
MNLRSVGALTLILGIGAAGAALAQDDVEERDMEAGHCVRVDDVDDIDIVDADTLIFRMRGGEVYRNDLPHECPGMRSRDTLMYRSSVGKLCSVDIVTVLEDWGFGFAPGVSCGLGMFHPITEQIAEEMTRAAE